MTPAPLANRRVLVTRGINQAAKLSDGLRALGAIPVEVPVIEMRPPESYEPLDSALRDLSSYDWLILDLSSRLAKDSPLFAEPWILGLETEGTISVEKMA